MTEQEAGAFAERLTRIWTPITPFTIRLREEEDLGKIWRLTAMLDSELDILVEDRDEEWLEVPFLRLGYRRAGEQRQRGFGLLCTHYRHSGEVVDIHIYPSGGVERLIAQQQMHSFRRGCWLSGCDIEASAHEKVEWVQGFTRKEIEVWNLKM